MNYDSDLKEKTVHGTRQNPITGMHFTSGPHTSYPQGFFVNRHWHHTVEILHITEGSYLFEINLEEHLLHEGDLCFLNSEDLHQITGQTPYSVHDVLIFDPRILDFSYSDELQEQVIAPFLHRKLNFMHILRSKDQRYPQVLPLIRTLMELSIQEAPGWYVQCKLLLLKLLEKMYQHQLLLPSDTIISSSEKQKINRYKTIISYMEAHLAEPITLQELADTIPCNSQYLCRFFKEITGISPIQYLISLRLEQACALLRDTTKPILEISMECGFDNVSYFIRKFKEHNGCTPREYRKQRP